MSNSKKLDIKSRTKDPDDLVKVESKELIHMDKFAPAEVNGSTAKLSFKQCTTVAMLACANLFSTITYNCIVPFFPGEAQKKGLSTTEVGLIFGIFEFVTLIVSPLYGKYLHICGARKTFIFGLCFTGITTIASGFLNLLSNGRVFFWANLGMRCAVALGDTAFLISAFTIAAKCFPGRISTVVGIMETFAGLGFAVGPVVGGIFYEYGGFQLPFFVWGLSLIFSGILSCFIIEELDESTDEQDGESGIFRMLRIPVIWIMVFAVIMFTTSLSFFSPTLADHLAEFNLSPTFVGLMFLLCQGTYTIVSPIFGIIIDRWQCGNAIMVFGSIVTTISVLFIGPSPLLNIEKSLMLIASALAILGIAVGALYIPTYKNCLDASKEYGYEDGVKTYGCITGILQSAFAFGAFIGPTFGAFGVEKIGFGWTSTVIAFVNVIFAIVLIMFMVFKPKRYLAANV